MEPRYQQYIDNPSLLQGRFESGFPLIYPVDTVQVSSRWAGNNRNPLEGRRGYVHSIAHGMQSRFNRDYLIAGVIGDGTQSNVGSVDIWLYTLDLIERDDVSGIAKSIKEQFGCFLYLDDRVKTSANATYNERKTGSISSIQGIRSDNTLGVVVRDESVAEEISKLYSALNVDVGQEFDRRNVKSGFDNFAMRLRHDNQALFSMLEKEGILVSTYERLLRDGIYKEKMLEGKFKVSLVGLQEHSQFYASSRDVALVERFLPNDLFRG